MMIFIKKVKFWHILLIYFIANLLISLALFSTWSIDYGIFYSTAKSLSENQIIYQDMFTHKGPAYFYFLNVLGNLFGWGDYKIAIPYFLTISYFLISNIFFIYNLNLEHKIKIFLYLLFLGFFSFQNANASLVYFQCANIIFSITFVSEFFKSKKVFYLLLSIIFISISILTRLDSITILIAIILSIILTRRMNLLNFSIIFFTPVIIYFFFSSILSFSLNDLYLNVLFFNSKYLEHFSEYSILSMFFRPNHFLIICASGLFISFLILISSLDLSKLLKELIKLLKKRENLQSIILIFSSVFLIITWLYSRVETNHHAILLQLGLYFFCIFIFITFPKTNFFIFTSILPIVFLGFMLTYLNSNFFFLKDINCIKYLSCKNLVEKKRTIQDIKNYKEVIILDSTGYEYVLANTRPKISINNWFLLWSEANGLENLSTFKKGLSELNNEKEITLWIRTTKLNDLKKKLGTEYNKKLIMFVDQGYYTKLILKPF